MDSETGKECSDQFIKVILWYTSIAPQAKGTTSSQIRQSHQGTHGFRYLQSEVTENILIDAWLTMSNQKTCPQADNTAATLQYASTLFLTMQHCNY